jgi:hypothetical protein
MARAIVIEGYSRGKFYAMTHPGCVVTATVQQIKCQYKFEAGKLYYRKNENISLPEHHGWGLCTLQTVGA